MPMTLIEAGPAEARTGATTIVVADDHDLYRAGLVRELRDNRRHFDLLGEAADGRAALALIVAEQPDLAVIDLRMPGLDGLEICHRLAALGSRTGIVILSAFTDAELVWLAEAAGARGYLDKGAAPGEIRAALRRAADGERVFSRPALASLNHGAPALD